MWFGVNKPKTFAMGPAPAPAEEKQPRPEMAPGIPIGAMSQALREHASQQPVTHPLQAIGGMSQMAMDQLKKSNPTLFEANGAFNWSRALDPNQGWQTTVA